MNSIDVLRYGHGTVVQTLDGLDESDAYTAGVCGFWSVKDIMAHLASYELVLIDVLQSLLGATDTPALDNFLNTDNFNDAEVERRQDASLSEIWAEYETAQARTVELLAQVPAEDRRRNGLIAWYGDDYDLEDFIAYAFYGHKREHCAEIGVYRDKLRQAAG